MSRTSGEDGVPIHAYPIFKDAAKNKAFHFMQPPMFWRKWTWDATDGLEAAFHWVMDIEWCTRAVEKGAVVGTTRTPMARFRLHGSSKTELFNDKQHAEQAEFYKSLMGNPNYRRVPLFLASAKAKAKALAIRRNLAMEEGRILKGHRLGLTSRLIMAALSVFGRTPILGEGKQHVTGSRAPSAETEGT